ncbi:MAG: amidohydrolase [Anaerolineales bacterium]
MLVLYNANIHTLDLAQPKAEALLVAHGRIKAVGDDRTILSQAGQKTSIQDMEGRCILPGLVDAHIHLQQYALGLRKVDCETSTKAACLERVAARKASLPAGEWLLGHGWNQNDWSDGFGTAAELDQITAGYPVYLTAKSLHAGWANSLALRKANITAETPDPPGGRISRGEDGQPDGILYENAMQLVAQVIPEPTIEQIAQAIRDAQTNLWQLGVTGVHDFDRRQCFQALQVLYQRGELGLRVVKSIPLEDLAHAVAVGLRSGFGDDMLWIGSVKAFADGALGPRTAAMLQPYDGETANRGMLLLDREELAEHGRIAAQNGLSLAVHAIGDRANHEVLAAFSQIRAYEQDNHLSPLRHRIEHVQLIHPQDAHRLAELNVIASMQPIHATSDMLMADRYWGARSSLAYAWRTQVEHGAVLAFGSDAPVELPNPFLGLHAAITRRRADGSPSPEGWYPEQKLDRLDALRAYTTGAAYTAGRESSQGKVAAGYLADLIVLDDDPLTCDINKIRDLRPVSTMVSGKWVYQS